MVLAWGKLLRSVGGGVNVGPQAHGAGESPLRTTPTTPVLPGPVHGDAHWVSAWAMKALLVEKHSSGWRWMSRRRAVISALAARMESINCMAESLGPVNTEEMGHGLAAGPIEGGDRPLLAMRTGT